MEKHREWVWSWFDGLRLSLLYTKPEGEIKGVLQISHGMCENKERYLPFMEYLGEHGYAAVIHDHRGHGKSVKRKEDLGYFYGGRDKGIVEDLHQVTCWIKEHFPGVPVYMLGHSMGSLAARVYLKDYDRELKKLILTGPPSANPAADLGLFLAVLQKKLRGGRFRSKLIQALAFGPYAARFPGEGSESAWICSDKNVIEDYDQSEYCGFVFTADAFQGLFLLLKDTYSSKGWKMKNPQLPVLFLGGGEDPCIGGGRKFVKQLQFLKKVGYQHVTGKMYPGMRHEILNEVEKEKVYANILSYLSQRPRCKHTGH